MTRLFSAVDHVGIAVADLDEAIEWYARIFGMHVVHEEVNDEMGVREAMLQVGDDASGTQVQLLAPLHSDTTIGRFLDRFGPGIQQVAYRVENIDVVVATLQERGIRPLCEAPRRGTAGARVNFIHPKDAGGVLVELIEPPGGSDVLGEQ